MPYIVKGDFAPRANTAEECPNVTVRYKQKGHFKPEIRPNLPENYQISTLFGFEISQKCLGIPC